VVNPSVFPDGADVSADATFLVCRKGHAAPDRYPNPRKSIETTTATILRDQRKIFERKRHT
jgi:hypothetical protein